MTTHKPAASACLACGEPFENIELQVGAKNRIAESSGSSEHRPTPGPQEMQDPRNWYVKVVNRRAKGGFAVGVLMMILGLAGKSVTKGSVVAGGGSLVAIGLVVSVIAVGLILVTRRPGL
ncbi:hypothetical protein [Novipirellula sp.]|uniref:hypothetical protein n=1 Tax=Novipirellula sp. TaxID=2795430 RepID=UPI003565936D